MESIIILSFHLLIFVVYVFAYTKNDCQNNFYIGRNATDCSKWFRCVFGIPFPMMDCPNNTLFSLKTFGCVQRGSPYDDCPVGKTSASVCNAGSPNILEKYDNCAQFYNCSLPIQTPGPGYLGDNIDECPYPQLFSTVTSRCEHFESVDCGSRRTLAYACDYKREQCPVAACKPCEFRYPDCRLLPDGNHVWRNMRDTPQYAYCNKGRGFPRSCPVVDGRYQKFSAITRRCESYSNMRRYFLHR